MNNLAIRIGAGVVIVCIGLAVRFMNKSSASEDYRKQAHRMIAQVEGYSTKPDYYDWLADSGHDAVFGDAYHSERRGRYSEKTWVDRDQYLDELFVWMIAQAKTDNAAAVADGLTKFREQHWHPDGH